MPADRDVLALLNTLRVQGASCGGGAGESLTAAPPLQWNGQLAEGAARLARRLAADRSITHAPDGLGLESRLRDVNYRYQRAAENIAAGPPTLDAAAAGWMASPGHCANLMAARLREVGVACAAAAGDGKTYWAMVLGTRAATDGLTAIALPP